MNLRRAALAAALAVMLPFPALAQPADGPPRLRGARQVARAYDLILDARFDRLEPALRDTCPPAPGEVCTVLRVTAGWWRLQLDPLNRTDDEAFARAVDRAIAVTEAWTRRAPRSAEAWFYHGAAYALRVQFRVLRDAKVAAARDGKRIKEALERALALDPGLDDAYFGVGMYRYYADVAPAAAKIFRWLLFLPGGDRREGLQQMLRAREGGELLRDEADFQLHLIYLWYENRPDRALDLLTGLRDRHPSNPLFPLLIGDIQEVYFHDPGAALATYRSVLAAARSDRLAAAGLAEARARLGIARQLEALVETDRAIEHLKEVLEQRPAAPYSARALAALRLGLAYDRMGRRDLASAAYRSAIASAPPGDPLEVAEQAEQALRRAPDEMTGEAYRLSLDGWRALQRRDLDHADALFTRSLQLRESDPVTHYRVGRLHLARGDDAAALGAFERAIALRSRCPATVLAAAFLDAGRVHERAGRRDAAAAMYRRAADVFGASSDTRTTAERALARITAAS